MGYDRNDRGYGREGYGARYGGESYGQDRDRGSRGYGRSDERASYGSDGRGSYDRGGYDRDDRGFFDRAGDEVRSWFGDEEAERRRERDEREYERQYRAENADRGRGWRDARGFGGGRFSRDDHDAAYAASYGAFGTSPGGGYENRDAFRATGSGRQDHDPHYREWRDRQMETLDRDYHDYRRENQGRFDDAFGSWRQNRQTQRDSLQRVQEHQEVVGSDGQHIGTVDHVRGDRILLTKTDKDAGGHHHSIPSAWIRTVGDKVEISKTADEAKRAWREEQEADKDRGALFGGEREGRTNLNRSFSGTY